MPADGSSATFPKGPVFSFFSNFELTWEVSLCLSWMKRCLNLCFSKQAHVKIAWTLLKARLRPAVKTSSIFFSPFYSPDVAYL